MVEIRKRFPPESIAAILEASIPKEDTEKDNDHDDSDGEPPAGHDETKNSAAADTPKEVVANKGTLVMDATCCPADIAFPQDFQLLDHARELLERLSGISAMNTDGECHVHTARKPGKIF